MRRNVLHLLLAANVALLLLLAALWLLPAKWMRGAHWTAPAPLRPDLAALLPPAPAGTPLDTARYRAILERPVFAPNRRMGSADPAPVAGPAKPAAPDPLANIRLVGVFTGAVQGIVATVDGKNRKVMVDGAVGDWTLKSIRDREVTFTRGAETRLLRLLKPQEKGDGTGKPPAASSVVVVPQGALVR